MAKNRVVVHNASAARAIVVQVCSLYDGEVLAELPLPPGKTGLVPVSAGAVVLHVLADGARERRSVWNGAVPADGAAPIEIEPDRRRATYRGRTVPSSSIIEGFRQLRHDPGAGTKKGPIRVALCAVVVVAVLAIVAWWAAAPPAKSGRPR